MEESSPTSSTEDVNALKRYEYEVTTVYSVHATNGQDADGIFRVAMEHATFSDRVIISQEIIKRVEEIPDGGEKHWVWNRTLSKWELRKVVPK